MIHGAIMCAHAVYLLFRTISPTDRPCHLLPPHAAPRSTSASASASFCWHTVAHSLRSMQSTTSLPPPCLVALNILLLIKYITRRNTKAKGVGVGGQRVNEIICNCCPTSCCSALLPPLPAVASYSCSCGECRVSSCRTFNARLRLANCS